MSRARSAGETDEVRILDARGCLTLESMCFTQQLTPEQRAVVERHVRACTVCAQQHTDLARVTERLRSARPRVPIPAEARLVARQVVVRSLTQRRSHRVGHRSTARVRTLPRPVRVPWHKSRAVWAAALAGLLAALVLAVLALVLL